MGYNGISWRFNGVSWDVVKFSDIPSGKLTHSDGKWSIWNIEIVDLPNLIGHGDVQSFFACLPGKSSFS